jgi:diguanylate cyclase (GGDEF)-like protein/PAS domain S-box-containing protein
LGSWYIPDSVFRLAILGIAAVAIPTLVRKRTGGSSTSYTAITCGLVVLMAGEAFRLATAVDPDSWVSHLIGVHLPTYAGGYLLMMIGFVSLMQELGRARDCEQGVADSERKRANLFHLQEVKLRAVLNAATDYGIISCDLDGLITSYSTGGARILGWTAEEVVGRINASQLRAADEPLTVEDAFSTVRRDGHFEAEVLLAHKNGSAVSVLLTMAPLTDASGRLEGYVGLAKDISEIKKVQNALRRERDFIRGIIETNQIFILGVSMADNRITIFNQGAELISGFRRDEVIGREYPDVLVGTSDRGAALEMFQAIQMGANGPIGQSERQILTKGGDHRLLHWTYSVSMDENGQPAHVVAFGRDVTAEREMQNNIEAARRELEQANTELKRMASTDFLTGLTNRRQATTLFERELARCRRLGTSLGVILMDFDHFKAINDTYGHEVGDAVLKHVADLLRSRLRATDVIARQGGEEFLIILPETGLDDTAFLADTVRHAIQENPLIHGSQRIPLSVSSGVTSLEPGQDTSMDLLTMRADEAMYCAKNLGRNRVVVWNRIQEGKVEPSLASSERVQELQKCIEDLKARNHEALLEGLYQLVETLEGRNAYLANHSVNSAHYAMAIGREMGFSEQRLEVLRRAAMLHDIGNIAIPDEILWKDGPLSKADWALVCQHPAASVKIIENMPSVQAEVRIIRHHHERPDGRGYPDGIVGEAIPVEARILAVADAIEAMTRVRCHRTAYSVMETLDIIHAGAPKQFDAEVVQAAMTVARKEGNWPIMGEPQPQPVGEVGSIN